MKDDEDRDWENQDQKGKEQTTTGSSEWGDTHGNKKQAHRHRHAQKESGVGGCAGTGGNKTNWAFFRTKSWSAQRNPCVASTTIAPERQNTIKIQRFSALDCTVAASRACRPRFIFITGVSKCGASGPESR